MSRKSPEKIRWSLAAASLELGMSRESIRRALQESGQETGDYKTFSPREVFTALMGDGKRERTRETKNRADILHLELLEKQRTLVPLETAKAVVSEKLMPIREQLLAMPSELCVRCNPSDPELARDALEHAVEKILRHSSGQTQVAVSKKAGRKRVRQPKKGKVN